MAYLVERQVLCGRVRFGFTLIHDICTRVWVSSVFTHLGFFFRVSSRSRENPISIVAQANKLPLLSRR